MIKAKILKSQLANDEKGKHYVKIFPINTGNITPRTIEEIEMFAKKLRNIKKTNLTEFVDYLLSIVTEIGK